MRLILLIISMLYLLPLQAGNDTLDENWYRRYISNKLVQFAKMFEGTPYDYANTDPMRGFDCSGFVQFVYGNFNIRVPRSSGQYQSFGKEIPLDQAEAGDILLFTGSDAGNRTPGHLGIVISAEKPLQFMHSATSNRRGIMISSLNEAYFQQRFIKVVRVL